MFDHKHYVPILKGKAGEYRALEQLSPQAKTRLTPLIEIPPIPWDFENDQPAQSIDQHLNGIASKLEAAWGTQRPFFLDLLWIEDQQATATGVHPLVRLCDDSRNLGVQPIPVTGVGRPPHHQAAVASVIAQDHRGVCFRLAEDDFNDFAATTAALQALGGQLGVQPAEVDLLLDMDSIAGSQPGLLAQLARTIIQSLPNITTWRTVTLAATAFPLDLTQLTSDAWNPIARTEWAMWATLAANRQTLHRMPTFGDYVVAHPEPFVEDPRLIQITAQLRYTCDQHWLVYKGRSIRRHPAGNDQFYAICQQLVARPEYRGPQFSAGDAYIHQRSQNQGGPGNPTTWRQAGSSHHLTFVTEQIANHPGL